MSIQEDDVIPTQLVRSGSPENAQKLNSLKEMTSKPEIQAQLRSRLSEGHGSGNQGYSIEKLTANEESLALELESAAKQVTDKVATCDDDSNILSKRSDSETEEPTNFNSNNSNNNSSSHDPDGSPVPWMEGDSELSDIEEVSETSDKLDKQMEHQQGLREKPGFSCNQGNNRSPMVLYTK